MFKRKPKKEKTRIVVQFDAGFANQVYLRGDGVPELNWSKGVPLKNVKANEWVWETEASFKAGEFKVLINDQTFEAGSNHHIYPGTSIRINPKF
jgi:hypothetical protein